MSAHFDNARPSAIDHVHGDVTGLMIPAHGRSLHAMGPDFLTTAFRAFGSLARDNRVVRIVRIQDCISGSTGTKLFLTVEYERPEPSLHTELFVKFSRDFDDPLRDRGAHEMESEIHFAQLTRDPAFPIDVPQAYFADYHQASHTGMLVTERIAYGTGRIEPQHVKCMDHLLDDPLPYYRANITALARIAAAHKSGRLGTRVDALFPFDIAAARAADPIRWSREELSGLVGKMAEFGRQCPGLLPGCVHAPGFWQRFERTAQAIRRNELAIKDHLHADPDYVALCHWNANIDNAWYWRDDDGSLHCGLIDWGRVRQMNLACAIWGCLLAAPQWLWDGHLDEMLELFVAEFRNHGGPLIEAGRLKLYLDVYVAAVGLALMMEMPGRILHYLPEAPLITDVLDPRLLACERALNQRHVLANFLTLWDRHDFGRSLEQALGCGVGD